MLCGDGALTLFDDPTITVRVNGVAAAESPTASVRPAGVVWNLRVTVCG